MATVTFTEGFTLLCDDGRRFEFAAGEQEIPDELADHWYVKAHCEDLPAAYDSPEVTADAESTDDPVAEPEKRKAGRPKKL